jgi:hypothetical protein
MVDGNSSPRNAFFIAWGVLLAASVALALCSTATASSLATTGSNPVQTAFSLQGKIEADLGDLGEIAVSFNGAGRAKVVRSRCGKPFSYELGHFEGKIDFRGEEGFTEVEATSAPAAVSFFEICSTSGHLLASHNRPQGAELHVRNVNPATSFSVFKRRHNAAALFGVAVSEEKNGISIQRYVTAKMPSRTFHYMTDISTLRRCVRSSPSGEPRPSAVTAKPTTAGGEISRSTCLGGPRFPSQVRHFARILARR